MRVRYIIIYTDPKANQTESSGDQEGISTTSDTLRRKLRSGSKGTTTRPRLY